MSVYRDRLKGFTINVKIFLKDGKNTLKTLSVIVPWIPAVEVDKGPAIAHADQKRGQDINNAENQGAQEGGPESCNVKPLDDAPDEIEDQAIDYERKEPKGKNRDGEGQEDQDGPQKGIDESDDCRGHDGRQEPLDLDTLHRL